MAEIEKGLSASEALAAPAGTVYALFLTGDGAADERFDTSVIGGATIMKALRDLADGWEADLK